MNKLARISLFITIFVGAILLLLIIIPITYSDESQQNDWIIWSRTSSTETIKNIKTGEYQTTLFSGAIFIDDESKRYENLVEFNQVVNMSFDLSSGNVTYSYKTKQREYSVTARMFFVVNVTQSECNTQGWNWFDNHCYLWWNQARTFMQNQGIGYNVLITDNTYSYKYGLNFTSIPLTYQSKLLYVGMRLEDVNGLTWDDINLDTENRRIIIKDKIALGYDDLLESGYTLNLYDKKTVLIGNVINKTNLWLDPTIILSTPINIVDNSSTGTNAWNNPSNAGASDNSYTSANCSGAGCQINTHYLKATNWSAEIPDLTINGILVEVEVSAYCLYGCGASVRLVLSDDSFGSQILYNGTSTTSEKYLSFGNLTYLWGESLNGADINNENFGIAFNGTNSAGPGGSMNYYVDHIRMTINYTPYITIISPTEGQIFTQDTATTLLNISTAINMTTCYYNNGSTNFTMSKLNNTYFFNSTAGTQYLDSSAHSVKFYCNQSTDGTWRTSDTINFEVDSVNITRCRDLNVSREYLQQSDILDNSLTANCMVIKNPNVVYNGNGYYIKSDDAYSGIYSDKTNTTIKNANISMSNTSSTGRGIYIGSNSSILNNTILNGYTGIIMIGDFNTLSDNFLNSSISTYGIYLSGSSNNTIKDNIINFGSTNVYLLAPSGFFATNNTFLNTTYSTETLSGAGTQQLTRKWYFQTQVNNSAGYLSGATVNIYDKSGTLMHSQLTGATGQITRQEVIEYINNGGTKTFSTPHTVNISKTDYVTNSTVYNLTTATNVMEYVTLTLSNTAPTVTLSTPSNNSWTNSLTNNLICNSTDADANLNNVTIYTWNASGTNQNSAPTTDITGSSNSTTFSSVGFINQGANKWNCKVCDSDNSCAWATSNFTLNTDTINPNINIIYPTNNTNTSNTQINVNYTRSDTNLGSCWYTRNLGATNTTLSNCINISGVTWNEGKNNITIYANDSANNKNSSSVTFTLDTIKPNINIVTPINNSNLSYNTVNINYTVSDVNLASCWYSNDTMSSNTSITCGTNITTITWSEGQHNVTIWANDSVNNINSSSVRFFVDTIYPLISYGTGTENTNTNFSRNWIYVNTSWTELNFKNITFRLYNATATVNTTTYTTSTYLINFTNLIDNNYTYEVNITDITNNKNGTGIRRILIDDTPPTVNIVYPLEGGTYNFNNISINWTVSDNLIGLSSCWYTNNSGVTNNSVTCNQNFTQNLSDGSYTYSIYSNDTLNNIGSQTRIFGISTTAPAIVLNAPSNNQWFNNGTNIYFNFTATDSDGLSTCRLYANWTGSWAINYTWNSPNSGVMNWTTRNLTNGNYIWNVWCNDTNNNGQFSVSNRTVKIDTIIPLISYGTGTSVDKANLSQSNIYVNVTFTEINFANITFNLLNDTATIYSTVYTTPTYEVNWTGLANGNYSYYMNITDSANNKNSTEIRYITLDTTNPNASLIYPSNNTFNSSTSYNFTANLSDNWGIKNSTLYVYNETGEENRTTTSFGEYVTTYTLGIVVTVVEGIKNWWYDVWDWAGNFFQTGNYTLTVDTTYPSVILSGFTPTTIYNDNDVVIFANITDTYLNIVWLRINFTGSYQNITITNKVGDTYNYTILSTVIENFENISWYWYANDSSNNVNVSSLSSFLVSNRNPYNVNITNPLNGTFKNTNWIWVNFTGSDDDGDTLNYSLYNSTNGINFSFFSSTIGSSLNFSNYNFTEGITHYLYVTSNDTQLQNISSNISFTIDNTNPVINTISKPDASPTYQCSMNNIALNYSVSDTNLDYCTLNVTFGGLISTAHTIISDCSNTTFNVSYDNSVQELNLYVYDKAGNIDSETRLIYIDTDNAGCPQPTPSAGGGGGTPTYITPPSNKTFCGDGICQSVQRGFLLGNDAGLKEDFWNCFQDCGQNVTLPNFLCNPFKNITEEEDEQCIWSSPSPFRVIFFIIAGVLVFVLLFKIEKPEGRWKVVFKPYQYVKRKRRKKWR